MASAGSLTKNNIIQKSKLLIVEGNHERDFFPAWLKWIGLDDIQVMPIGGKTKLPASLSALVKQRMFLDGEVVSMVIVRDADDNPAAAFQAVKDAVQSASLPTPSQAMLLTTTSPKTGLVIVPAADRRGALEELRKGHGTLTILP